MIKKLKFKIEGLDCSSCALNIDVDLEELQGIKFASTNYAKEITDVTYDDMVLNIEEILATIKNCGHKATVI